MKSPSFHTGDTVAKLSIPRLSTQLYIVEGDDERELRRGPGHMPGTVMPGARARRTTPMPPCPREPTIS